MTRAEIELRLVLAYVYKMPLESAIAHARRDVAKLEGYADIPTFSRKNIDVVGPGLTCTLQTTIEPVDEVTVDSQGKLSVEPKKPRGRPKGWRKPL